MEEIKKIKSEAALREEKVLQFWQMDKTFEKTLEQTKGRKEFIFYEGPPTANGKPGIHHLEARAFKDAIPRYKTMRGFHVRRKGGWDTHGLPVELQVEKKLGLNSKKAIEEYGIGKFNQECKESVWEYLDVWNKFTTRIGYWVDQEHPYVTYHNDFIESVWNVVKETHKKDLLYKDYRVVPWCPRCGTALSSHELAQGYEDVKDLSVTAKFKILANQKNSAVLPASGLRHGQNFSDLPSYFLAWTTTPWTLPGNVALAVGEDIIYVKVKVGNEIYILAKERISVLTEPYEILEEVPGKDLIGLEYEPLYPYFTDTIFEKEKPKLAKAFKVYGADFVNTADGTGIVHTAVMYGQDDFVLGTKIGLPKHHLVGLDGKFLPGTGPFEGRFVKDEEVAVDIIKDLAHRGLLFKKEKYEHSYPHCWRCHTALIYYARDSWYIRMSDPKIKNELIKENEKINWEPEHIREGRFGEWLREIKDWAVSRERYWGTPFPVWICDACKEIAVLGSIEELKNKTKTAGNKYFVMRHGEAENNVAGIYSSNKNINHLTKNGREQVIQNAEVIRNKKITKIYSSPFLRTRETAELVAEKINFPKEKIIYDDRIRELEFGDFSERPVQDFWNYMKEQVWKFDTKIKGGESFQDTKKRIGNFLYDIDEQNKNEVILIVSHGLAVEVVPAIIEGADKKRSFEIFNFNIDNRNGELHHEHGFIRIPHNENYELDLHRPYIDEVKLVCKCGGNLIRTKEVMDVWFDSGCVPFAEDHYPFENKKWIDGPGYPADFICEAVDQTRGWFYTLHAVGTLMGRGRAFKNVICLGHLLDAKGKKMSKSLGNVVDPWEMMDKYGVDTLRLFMYSVNQPGESKNFDEKTVALLYQQVFGLLYNVLAFYELYRDPQLEISSPMETDNTLDQWILARFEGLLKITTDNLDNYKLLEPVRAMRDFIGDLSTWYLRRSRDRIKNGDKNAKQTLYFVLKNLAKIMAPFAPLATEDIWMKLRTEKDVESVHLALWPEEKKKWFFFGQNKNSSVLVNMEVARDVVRLGLEARQKEKILIRQSLAGLYIEYSEESVDFPKFLSKDLLNIITEEINVKKITFKKALGLSAPVIAKLDTEITFELKQEGDYRELVRALQDMRKKKGFTPSDFIVLSIEADDRGKKLIEKFENDMKKTVLISKIEWREGLSSPEEIKIYDMVFKVKIEQ